jgi:Ca2+-binding EF-hand superfamily protein
MLRILALALGLSFAVVLTTRAADGEKKGQEQKSARKELIDKYDKNKDGKLDREERQAMSAEDKEKWQKASGGARKKKQDDSK